MSHNVAPEGGGGIVLTELTLTLVNTTLSDNSSSFGGGGILQEGGSLVAVNTTVSGNSGLIEGGGAILKTGGDATLVNSTVTGNESRFLSGPGDAPAVSGAVTLSNTIVADQEERRDCEGSITSLGHNLDSDGSCGLTATGDLPSTNANLGPLADNGGPTRTHELLEGSDAIGAGDDAVCAAEPVNGVDQRGVQRPFGRSCDIGAFEAEFDPVPTVLTAEPALLHVEGGLHVRLLDLSARLVRADTKAPVEGETVVMTVNRLLGGSQEVCTVVTDADGVATCSGNLGSLLGLVLGGYTATFVGTDEYEPSGASASLIRIG